MKKRGISGLIIFLLLSYNISVSFSLGSLTYNLTYDGNGNLVQGFDKYYEYNGFNELVLVREFNSTGRIIGQYSYDHEGKRIKKSEYGPDGENTTIYYISDNFVQIVNSSGIFNITYYYDEQILVAEKDSNGNLKYYHPDHLGSASLVTNESGDIIEKISYLPYGETFEGGDIRYLFTGKEKDRNTELYYYGARYYSPEITRFIQPDTIIQNIYNPQNLNRYSYVLNNPYKYTDPSGNYIETLVDVAFIGYDLSELYSGPTSITNWLSLGADVACAMLPFVAGGGLVVKGAVKGTDLTKDLSKVEKIGDTVRVIGKTGTDLKAFSRSNFRENVLKLMGESGLGKEAHHNLPQAFSKQFEKAGININDPKFGSIVEKLEHRQMAYNYNKQFEKFFSESVERTAQEIINYAREVSSKFGFSPRF